MSEMKETLSLDEALGLIRPLDADSMAAAAEHQNRQLEIGRASCRERV